MILWLPRHGTEAVSTVTLRRRCYLASHRRNLSASARKRSAARTILWTYASLTGRGVGRAGLTGSTWSGPGMAVPGPKHPPDLRNPGLSAAAEFLPICPSPADLQAGRQETMQDEGSLSSTFR